MYTQIPTINIHKTRLSIKLSKKKCIYVSDNLGLVFFFSQLKLPSLSWKDAAYWHNGRHGAGKHVRTHLCSTLLRIEGERWLKLIRKVSQFPEEKTQQWCHNTTLILKQIFKTSGNIAHPSTPALPAEAQSAFYAPNWLGVSDEHLLTYEGAAGGQNEKLYL